MTVVKITYCECKKKIVSCWIKQTLKQILSRMLLSYIAKKQTSANILEYMINQVLS